MRIAALVRCGELCKSCGPMCRQEEGVCIACIHCNETGQSGDTDCAECSGRGFTVLNECPRKFVGSELTEVVNVAGLCEGGVLPVAGGLVDQSAWFVAAWQLLRSEESRIESDKWKSNSDAR